MHGACDDGQCNPFCTYQVTMRAKATPIGHGQPLFVSLPTKAPLRLVARKTYDNGVVNLRYEKR